MDVPDINYFDRLVKLYCVPNRIRNHNLAVAATSSLLSKEDPLAVALGLFHDVFKTASLDFKGLVRDTSDSNRLIIPTSRELVKWYLLKTKYNGMHEVDIAAEIIGKEKEFSEFAKVLKEVGSTNNPAYLKSKYHQARIAHYADWRVRGTTIVPLQERLDYLHKRYFTGRDDEWKKRKRAELELENAVLERAGIRADDLSDRINSYLEHHTEFTTRMK
ncbi:hypothetical protein JXA85_05955 [Candidatus Woesearchaeota archaeon]|nr:hypothetical protein [Candidatus Woesearchaeota archaeon]